MYDIHSTFDHFIGNLENWHIFVFVVGYNLYLTNNNFINFLPINKEEINTMDNMINSFP